MTPGDCFILSHPDGAHRGYAKIVDGHAHPGHVGITVFEPQMAGDRWRTTGQKETIHERDFLEFARPCEPYEYDEAAERGWRAPDHEWRVDDHFEIDEGEGARYGQILDHVGEAPSGAEREARVRWLARFDPKTPHVRWVKVFSDDGPEGPCTAIDDRRFRYITADQFVAAQARGWRPERTMPKAMLAADAAYLAELRRIEYGGSWRAYARTFGEIVRRSGVVSIETYERYVAGVDQAGDAFIETLHALGLDAALKKFGLFASTTRRSRKSKEAA